MFHLGDNRGDESEGYKGEIVYHPEPVYDLPCPQMRTSDGGYYQLLLWTDAICSLLLVLFSALYIVFYYYHWYLYGKNLTFWM